MSTNRREPFGIQTITALIDVVSGGAHGDGIQPIGLYRGAGRLEEFLGRAGLELHVGGGSRVPAVREVLVNANRNPSQRSAIDRLLTQVCDPREYIQVPEKEQAVVEHLNHYLEYDDLELRKIGRQYQLFEKSGSSPVVTGLSEKADRLSFETVSADLERALKQASDDPEDSITAACSIVESVCKCILDEMNLPYPPKQDIQGLIKAVAKELRLDPSREDLPEGFKQDIKQILGGLQSVAGGIGALRTHAGDAHGRGRNHVRVDARIARLAAYSASTISLFLIETWQLHHGGAK